MRPVLLREVPMLLKTVPVILFVGAAAFVTSSTVHVTRAAKVPVVTVHAKDFAFEAPKTIAPGMTSFKLVNDGKALHHLQIIKLEEGKTFADLQAAMKVQGPPPGGITTQAITYPYAVITINRRDVAKVRWE